MGGRPPRPGRPGVDLTALRERTRPVTLAGEHALPVAPALGPLVPGGRLRRGTTVAVTAAPAVGGGPGRGRAAAGGGAGATGARGVTTLALALAGDAATAGSWVGVLGLPDLGVEAALAAGLAPDRLVVVDAPPAAWATAAAALVDALDVVLVGPPGRMRAADARRILTRARERGAVTVVVGAAGLGGQAADVALTVTGSTWYGIDGGHGHLRARRVEVVAGGRGAAALERRVALWLPGPDGQVALAIAEDTDRRHQQETAPGRLRQVG